MIGCVDLGVSVTRSIASSYVDTAPNLTVAVYFTSIARVNASYSALGAAGSFVAAPPGVVHTFAAGPEPSRVLNVHAPSASFHDWLRESG